MGQLIDFETSGVASLRRRVAEVEEANQDLIAFARGHSGAVSAIHEAALAAVDADGLDHLVHVVTQAWPYTLGLDAVALALFTDDQAVRADMTGLHQVERRIVERAMEGVGTVVLRGVERGHPLFGPASDLIRAEALIRLDGPPPLQVGVLMLGQRRPQGFETRHGSELLVFLGRVVSRMMARWLPHPR
ncbi:DUF484 family protein [Sphingomonas profundi]|uniref:DUF484 family protein n=1 Tax=Alterirhizorhabdus profundi TaxID=2681549 RepID=UPI0012E87AAF|nr:DUF484 family protein [Sphingomonas profundi]